MIIVALVVIYFVIRSNGPRKLPKELKEKFTLNEHLEYTLLSE